MIIQFGTSRFLQAHVDLFAWEARTAGQNVPGIVIVQVTDDAQRARRLPAFGRRDGFPVIVRGRVSGELIERTTMVRSVVGALAARRDWEELVDLFVGQATHVVSNTGDDGFEFEGQEPLALDGDTAPKGFCAILATLLYRRWRAGMPGITFLPCELVTGNGALLRTRVRELAARAGTTPAFAAWLDAECRWANTLVDRIVSEPIEPAGAIAEPYALWAIERQRGMVLPFTHPAIVLTDDLAPYERLKLHILNLGHSVLAQRWLDAGAAPGMTVRAALAETTLGGDLRTLYAEEVQPGFAAHGLANAAKEYIATTLERFANPFLDHRLADIGSNHAAKVERRIAAFVRWVDASGRGVAMPRLRAMVALLELAA